jgi:adenylate cyclase
MTLKRILVVDDEETIVDLCRRVLTGEGYDVQCASSGDHALKLDSSEKTHMAVMDMLMPGIDGLQTFLALKKKQPELLGVLITGHGTMDTAIQAMGLGFSGFIRKPFTPVELVHVVNDAFHKSALAEENTRLKTLIPLYKLGEKFTVSQTKKEVLDELIRTVHRQTDTQRISVMLYDEIEGCLRIAAAMGFKEDIASSVRIAPGERIAGKVFQSGGPIILSRSAKNNPKLAHYLKSKNIVAAISLPLKTRDKTLGVLNVSKIKKGSPFSQADIEMLSVISSQAVMALENFRIMDEKAEKIRMRTLFEQYVAPEVAEVLISHERNPMEVGEIKEITVLFADIRKFTHLVRHLPLETLRSLLNNFFDLLTDVIFRFKGTLDKFMGDAVLAIFGAPNHLDEPQDAAVSAAMEMLKRFDQLKKKWPSVEDPFAQIGFGIGISSGEMFLGNVGSQKRLDYTVIGTDVNIAQRLASEAASGQILITESVKTQLNSIFCITQESSRLLKGLDKPIPVFSVDPEGE